MSENQFVLCAVVVSIAECATASIVSWSVVFGVSQALKFLGAFVLSPLVVILVVSTAVGLLLGIALRKSASRWVALLTCLTGVHACYSGVSWFYAVAVSHF